MSTYYIRVSTGRSRVVKVEADSRHVAEAAAIDRLENDLLAYAVECSEIRYEDATADDWRDDDSIIAETHRDGSYAGYEYAADDPGHCAP